MACVTTPIIVLSGPTASGKSALAIDVARRLIGSGTPAEVVNADSMLVYRGMDIGTAKPTLDERGGVPHHLIDILDVTETASVADFQRLARATIADVRARGAVPLLVGGSALYTRAIVDDFDFPGSDASVRAMWEAELERVGPEALHAELARRDEYAASLILPGNGRRIVRALEVFELTGRVRPVLPEWTYLLDGVRQFGLSLDRAEMDARIETRVHAMFEAGLVAEVDRLRAQGLERGRTASRALGYRQVLSHLRGECTEPEARHDTIRGTRRFARKQLGWWRRDDRITWLASGDTANVDLVAGAAARVRNNGG